MRNQLICWKITQHNIQSFLRPEIDDNKSMCFYFGIADIHFNLLPTIVVHQQREWMWTCFELNTQKHKSNQYSIVCIGRKVNQIRQPNWITCKTSEMISFDSITVMFILNDFSWTFQTKIMRTCMLAYWKGNLLLCRLPDINIWAVIFTNAQSMMGKSFMFLRSFHIQTHEQKKNQLER